VTRVPASWLALREQADHDARTAGAAGLLPLLDAALGDRRPIRVVDVGAGTGSNLRWLAPRLPGPQEWVLVDNDDDLLRRAARASDGLLARTRAPIHVRIHQADLRDADTLPLARGGLLTASAMLDMLTPAEVESLVATVARAKATALFSLTVDGPATLDPADPLDADIAAAFAAHERRDTGQGRLSGAEGTAIAADALRRAGYAVHLAETPWTLGPADARLLAVWLLGWVAAAVEQEPRLAPEVARWRARRAAEHGAGLLRARVGHRDLLGVPPTDA
jgi:SAM-dependent methyltransferase